MLPPETHLELRSRLPARSERNGTGPPLLFVHGAFCDAWFWEPFFLPWFASQGYAAHALSLRGHGSSGGRESLFVAGLDDYAADVERVASLLPQPPVLIGHSMGSAVVERLLATRPVRAAALLAPLPPAGLMVVASRLAAERPDYLMQFNGAETGRVSAEVLRAIEPYYFSGDVRPDILRAVARHVGAESARALFDLSLRLHWQLPERGTAPVLVLGAEGDRICTPDDVRATARHHSVDAVIVPGLAHIIMLENQWERAARPILDWLRSLK